MLAEYFLTNADHVSELAHVQLICLDLHHLGQRGARFAQRRPQVAEGDPHLLVEIARYVAGYRVHADLAGNDDPVAGAHCRGVAQRLIYRLVPGRVEVQWGTAVAGAGD